MPEVTANRNIVKKAPPAVGAKDRALEFALPPGSHVEISPNSVRAIITSQQGEMLAVIETGQTANKQDANKQDIGAFTVYNPPGENNAVLRLDGPITVGVSIQNGLQKARGDALITAIATRKDIEMEINGTKQKVSLNDYVVPEGGVKILDEAAAKKAKAAPKEKTAMLHVGDTDPFSPSASIPRLPKGPPQVG